MKKVFVFAVIPFLTVFAAEEENDSPKMTFVADRIAADNVTHALAATGHVRAVYEPVTLRGHYLTRDADGKIFFHDPTCVTTCSNEVGHTHWNLTGELQYKEEDYVILRNCWLKMWEIPIFYFPYLYYPLDTDCGFSWMPGYTERWGAYLLTKFTYDILGDKGHGDNTWWLGGNTRFDLRWEQGIALGETLKWNLGDFGNGKFKVYYVWDQSDAYGMNGLNDGWNYRNWGSDVPSERWAVELTHRWEPTERDTVRVKGSIFSDSYFAPEFFRDSLLTLKDKWLTHEGNEAAWEHAENAWAAGISASGPLNRFYGGTSRLPEIYFDVNPRPFFGLPINYETENRVGYLSRQAARNGNGLRDNVFAYNPGPWADYDTVRFDTYHRLTAPIRACCDVLSIVPRLAYRGTYWNSSGNTCLTGWEDPGENNPLYRSILESGATLAARGTGWVDEKWRHTFEPYIDILAQEAWYGGAGNGRQYVFDSLDASTMWEDQFAGRGRNLPYSYYGVTPGIRNAWDMRDDKGKMRQIVDFDVYAALQFRQADWTSSDGTWQDWDSHKLAEKGSPNLGETSCTVMPGARLRWFPSDDITLLTAAEYDADRNRIAKADVGFKHKVAKRFSYYVDYALRDFRWWDFSSTPYDRTRMLSDDLNWAKFQYVQAGFEHQLIDWFAWSPFLRWDIKEGELDSVGAWFDYMTDCLGFRLLVKYDNEFTLIDGYRYSEEWHFGFYVYLRAFGADSGNIFTN